MDIAYKGGIKVGDALALEVLFYEVAVLGGVNPSYDYEGYRAGARGAFGVCGFLGPAAKCPTGPFGVEEDRGLGVGWIEGESLAGD